jgi:hypothetical protein
VSSLRFSKSVATLLTIAAFHPPQLYASSSILGRYSRFEIAHSIDDLFSDGSDPIFGETGIRGNYFGDSSLTTPLLERVDQLIDFNFAAGSPDPSIPTDGFSARWTGSIRTRDAGTYQFCTVSDDGSRLWINGDLVINRWDPGAPRLQCGFINLASRQFYSIVLEYYELGGDALVQLFWQPPGAQREVVPATRLFQGSARKKFIPRTELSSDDPSTGFEKGGMVADSDVFGFMEMAEEIAADVKKVIHQVFPCEVATLGAQECANQFAAKFGAKAYKRPLNQEEVYQFSELFSQGATYEDGIGLIVEAMIQSPFFIYAVSATSRQAELDDNAIAIRLAQALWGSLPDQELLAASTSGRLHTDEEIEFHARRMLKSFKAARWLSVFVKQWLKIENVSKLLKSPTTFPEFDLQSAEDLESTFALYVDQLLWRDQGTLINLLTTNKVLMTPKTAAIYGTEPPIGLGMWWATAPENQRSGVLTHPLWLAQFAHADSSAPILRGTQVLRQLLCFDLPRPPDRIPPLPHETLPGQSTRQKVESHTRSPFCQNCHKMINPVGFSFEHFDAVGAFRTEDNGVTVDPSGSIEGASTLIFSDINDLLSQALANGVAQDCFVRQIFRFVMGRFEDSADQIDLMEMNETFKQSGTSIRELLISAVRARAFRQNQGPHSGIWRHQ